MMFPSKHSRAVQAGFNVPHPKIADYGFSASFMRNTFDAEQQSKQTNATIKAFTASLIYALVLAFFVAFNFFPDLIANPSDHKFQWCSLIGLPFWIIYAVIKDRADNALKNDEEVRRLAAYDAAVATWERQCDDWMESKLETGLIYWQEKRGIGLEHALMRLFEKRGCEVQMTKTTGDGGVDLIVKIGGAVMWCQCKGHAKPISVAPIREIAGVCSRSDVQPVVFAVNGFTKPAQDTARELGVQLFDAHHLVALARRTDLADLYQPSAMSALG